MSNIIDKTVEFFSPETALRRETARKVLHAQRAYEASKPSRFRKKNTDAGSGDAIVENAGESLRLQARHLDENHDLARGVLNVLVNNVVGRGITIEPQVKTADGELAKEVNDQLLELWEEWINDQRVEVTDTAVEKFARAAEDAIAFRAGIAEKDSKPTELVGYTGVFSVAKASGAVTQGQKLYWNSTNSNLTTTASGNTLVGVAAEAAASGDATAKILLNVGL